jgi:hypothetical protein
VSATRNNRLMEEFPPFTTHEYAGSTRRTRPKSIIDRNQEPLLKVLVLSRAGDGILSGRAKEQKVTTYGLAEICCSSTLNSRDQPSPLYFHPVAGEYLHPNAELNFPGEKQLELI